MGPGPAGIAQLEYLVSRLVCISVPLGFTALLVILVVAGFKYLTSSGETKAVQSAHQTVTWGLLGVLFLAIAWLILQLIQTFTGVEVTKFTLSSLPGVDGFTGSCWASPNQTELAQKDTPKLAAIDPEDPVAEVYIDEPDPKVKRYMTSCKNVYNYLSPPVKTDTYQPGAGYIKYPTNPFLTFGFEDTITHPGTITVLDGSIDNSLWIPTDLGRQRIASIISEKVSPDRSDALRYLYNYTIWGTYYGANYITFNNIASTRFSKFEKDKLPIALITMMFQAQQTIKDHFNRGDRRVIAYGSDSDFKETFSKFDFDQIDLIGFSCADADFYNVVSMVSPIIYIYHPKPTDIRVQVFSPHISSIKEINGQWQVKTANNGNLVINDKQHRFIPYEFLRRDFKRPKQGFVVDKEHFIAFLKDNLWKKLGLTDTEIEDYWQDIGWRIPESPYYFISLIDRAEIDRVLPMEVNPKPDTIIRNMTYILPLDKPFIPMPINIKAPDRKGFTVLENGGFVDGF